MSSDKCRYLEDVVKLVDRKPSGKRDAVLMEHAASCCICGPVLAAAMKTLDDEREGRIVKASGELKAEALDAALVELQKSYPKRKAAWWAGFKPAYAAAAACLLIALLFIINISPDPLTQSYSFNSPNLRGFKGGDSGRGISTEALHDCFKLGYNMERLNYFAGFTGKSNPEVDRLYRNLLASMSSKNPNGTIRDVLDLGLILDNYGNAVPSDFNTSVNNLEDSVTDYIEFQNIEGSMQFFNLGRAKGALVNLGYAPETYTPGEFLAIDLASRPSFQNKGNISQLESIYNEFLAREGELTRDDAKTLYKKFVKAEKAYFK